MKNTYVYPAILHYAEDGISIGFPDLPGCTSCSDTTEEAARDAREALGVHLWGMERDGDPIPEATPADRLPLGAKEIPLLVEVYMPAVRARLDSRYVKKTLSVPARLNAEAERLGINFSQTLQEALAQKIESAAR